MVNKICLSSVSEENKLHQVYMEFLLFILRTLYKRIIVLTFKTLVKFKCSLNAPYELKC